MNKTYLSLCLTFGMMAAAAHAQVEAFQMSFTPKHALHDQETRIEGLTLSIWGENPQSALSIGLVNGSTGASQGLSFGLVNYSERYAGAQWSFANFSGSDFAGWQGGPLFGLLGSVVNYCGGSLSGVQTGCVNLTGGMSGVQVGILNYAQEVKGGVQIGIVNLIGNTGGWFTDWPNEIAPGMVFVNWKF